MKIVSLLSAIGVLAFSVLCLSCQDDVEASPSYRQDLADIEAISNGVGATLTRDDGTTLTIDNSSALGKLSPNVVYRSLAVYVETSGDAHVYACSKVLSPNPEAIRSTAMKRDPVKNVLAVWRGGRYVNLHLTVSTSNHSHHFAFADNGVRINADGSQTWLIELYHGQNGDGDYYTREVYLSCPVGIKKGMIAGRDSVEMKINTYEGTITKRLIY